MGLFGGTKRGLLDAAAPTRPPAGLFLSNYWEKQYLDVLRQSLDVSTPIYIIPRPESVKAEADTAPSRKLRIAEIE